MQNVKKETASCLHYCYAIPVECLPIEILFEDKKLCRLSRDRGMCFARVLRPISWNRFLVVVATDPRQLYDERWSYVVEVPTSALPEEVRVTSLSAAIIPKILLDEDQDLRQVIDKYGECPAWFEFQLTEDLFRVRIASDVHYIHHKERSHVIYFSQEELLTYIGVPSEQERSGKATSVPAAAVRPAPQKQPVELTRLEPVQVSEEDLKAAVDTMDIPEDLLSVQAQCHGSKSWRRWKQLLELILYRAVLRALSHKKVMQEIIRRVLVARKRFSKRLIRISDMYEKDGHIYWTIQVYVPPSLI